MTPETQKPDWITMARSDRVKMLKALAESSATASEIAEHFENATKNTVIGYCRRYNVPLPRRRKVVRADAPKEHHKTASIIVMLREKQMHEEITKFAEES